ncbi:hypothetical protein C943_00526 [Mariniradius saccharolyticus AK6]|uniref:Uncharacterized protein n=1 Tax=Mariniradius saccharolyticus AK6 TaxID=1239962 RepID=M7XED4_9BACT|nr:hypothetical protein C943_00526 [Mariniradius saccharolyticus AK6]
MRSNPLIFIGLFFGPEKYSEKFLLYFESLAKGYNFAIR